MLLSLPAHVRNIISRFVLGGKTVHIDARPRGLRVRLCMTTENDSHAIESFNNAEYQHFPRHYQVRHAQCWSQDNKSCELHACLAILSVCRQLYTEAALLPFSTNEFAFDGTNSRSHDKFLDGLRPAQRKTIRRVHFGPQIFYLQAPFDPIEKLRGLQEVVLFLKDDVCGPISGDGLSRERIKWLINRLCDIKCASLRAVYVCISSELRIICWAQALGNQMHRARGEIKPGSRRLVLRCRPITDTPSPDCTAAPDGEPEALDRPWSTSRRMDQDSNCTPSNPI
jgi:hypothetical protein